MEKITVEQSSNNLRELVAKLESSELEYNEMLTTISYCQEQLKLARETQADRLIVAWEDMLAACEEAHRAGSIGIVKA